MITVDAAIVDPALPTIIRQPHIDAVTAEWVTSISFARGGLSPVPSALARFVVAGLTVVVQEGRRARIGRPGLVDPSPFRIRSFALGNVAALIVSLGELGILFALPLFLQGARDCSAFATAALVHAAGLAVTAAARDAAWFAASFVAVGLLATFALPRAQAAATLEERGAAGRPEVQAPEQEPTSGSEPEQEPALEPDVVGGSVSA